MAEKKTHTFLWIGLVGIGLLAAYEFLLKPSAWTVPANAAMVTAITNWINSIGTQQSRTNWMNYMMKGSQTDINNMYALITQYWDQNISPPGDLTAYFVNTAQIADPS